MLSSLSLISPETCSSVSYCVISLCLALNSICSNIMGQIFLDSSFSFADINYQSWVSFQRVLFPGLIVFYALFTQFPWKNIFKLFSWELSVTGNTWVLPSLSENQIEPGGPPPLCYGWSLCFPCSPNYPIIICRDYEENYWNFNFFVQWGLWLWGRVPCRAF